MQTVAALRHATRDPAHQVAADGAVWRATQLGSGVVSYRLATTSEGITCTAFGPGAEEALSRAAGIVGVHDDVSTFVPRVPLVDRAHKAHPGLRVPKTQQVVDALIPAVLGQKVTGKEAAESWVHLVRLFGVAAPLPNSEMVQPVSLLAPPTAKQWASVPSWAWHRCGVGPDRARTIQRALHAVPAVQRHTEGGDVESAYVALQSVPGVGGWTAAVIGHQAFGDADAIPWNDYHLGRVVGWALTGKIVPNEEVERLVAPWKPHRYRLWRLLELTPAARPPRRGPRARITRHAWH